MSDVQENPGARNMVRWRVAGAIAYLFMAPVWCLSANASGNAPIPMEVYLWGNAPSTDLCAALDQLSDAARTDFSAFRGKPDEMASAEEPSWESLFILPGTKICTISWDSSERENIYSCNFNTPSIRTDVANIDDNPGWLAASAGFKTISSRISSCGTFVDGPPAPIKRNASGLDARSTWTDAGGQAELLLRLYVGSSGSLIRMYLDFRIPDSSRQASRR